MIEASADDEMERTGNRAGNGNQTMLTEIAALKEAYEISGTALYRVPEDGGNPVRVESEILDVGNRYVVNIDYDMSVVIHPKQKDSEKAVSLQGIEELVIGRNKQNSIVLRNRRTSSKHCRIERTSAGGYMIRDAGSRNGTYLNGKRLTGEKMLNDQDEICVAIYRMIFLNPQQTEETGVTNSRTWPRLRLLNVGDDLRLNIRDENLIQDLIPEAVEPVSTEPDTGKPDSETGREPGNEANEPENVDEATVYGVSGSESADAGMADGSKEDDRTSAGSSPGAESEDLKESGRRDREPLSPEEKTIGAGTGLPEDLDPKLGDDAKGAPGGEDRPSSGKNRRKKKKNRLAQDIPSADDDLEKTVGEVEADPGKDTSPVSKDAQNGQKTGNTEAGGAEMSAGQPSGQTETRTPQDDLDDGERTIFGFVPELDEKQ